MDITGGFYIPDSPTRNPSDPADPPPPPPLSLENEVANVMAGLGSFWGKVRKQSVAALQTAEQQIETARKDLQPLVSKARANLDQIGETTKAELQRLSEAGSSASTGVMIGADGTPVILEEPKVDKGKGVDRSGDGNEAAGPNPGAAAAAFFAKMQMQLAANPNVQGLSKNLATLQSSVQTNLSHLPASLQTNIAQLQTQFAHIDISESQKVAEGYLHKGEHWLADFSTEVAKLAKDAVKVLPPTESELSSERNKKREERLRKAEQVALGRTDILVRRLRADSAAILLVDPARPPPSSDAPSTDATPTPTDTREAFSKFLAGVEDAGGLEGETWAARVVNELEVAGEGETGLKSSLAKLVPAKMTAEAFWSRYFFRVGQIGEDEQRRKQVLEVPDEQDEDFSWDNEDEDDTPSATAPQSTAALPSTPKPTPKPSAPAPSSPETDGEWGSNSAPPSAPSSPTLPKASLVDEHATPKAKVTASSTAQTSPRASSDGTSSYDVVGAASGNPSEVGEGEKKEKESDGEDSDWE